MSSWDDYPSTYRTEVVERIARATQAGDSVALLGLSGAGKSNVLGFIAHRRTVEPASPHHAYLLVDCNRLPEPTASALFRAMRRALNQASTPQPTDEFEALEVSLDAYLAGAQQVTFLLDRFDDVVSDADRILFNRLRAVRDAHKYALTYVTGTRHLLTGRSELSELLYAHTIWLGPLNASDARWNVARFTGRRGVTWTEDVMTKVIELSRGYPSLLRACAEAYADGCALEVEALVAYPAVRRRCDEFWSDQPSDDEIKSSGLANHPLLAHGRTPVFNTSQLTAKEHALLAFLQSRVGQVCEKDDIIRAVWPEDKVISHGIRDDSLAQLVRRLREKVEPDAASPRYILTVAGRGYRFAK